MLGNWFNLAVLRRNRRVNTGPARAPRRKVSRYRPEVLTLEGRTLPSTFQEFPLPVVPRDPTDQFHRERITTGPDGNLWFTDGVYGFGNASELVGRITPDGNVTEFSVDNNTRTQLYNITPGPDGNLWMLAIRTPLGTSDDQLVVIRMTPDGNYSVFGAFLGHNGEDFLSNVSPLAVGPDGNLWYTASFYQFPTANQGSIVGRITPTGDVTNFTVPLFDIAQLGVGGGITAGPDGTLWVAIGDGIHGEPRGVRRFSPDGQLSDVIPGSQPLSEMVTDANGNVWGLVSTDHIERIAPDGTVTDFPLPVHQPVMNPTPELNPLRMTLAAGPDGKIWFSDPYANEIGNITPDGTVTEYAVPTPDSFPAGITTGPDGNIWFTELGSGQIGEFVFNDAAGTGGGAAPHSSAGAAQAGRPAAVEALFTATRTQSLRSVALQQPQAASVDTVLLARPSEVVASSNGQAVGEAGMAAPAHPEGQAVAPDPAALADPLAEAL